MADNNRKTCETVKDALDLIDNEFTEISKCKSINLKRKGLKYGDKEKIDGNVDPWGLAISGGGIRSAVFSMGVLQAMVKENVLEKFHYMSTVSGGGYIGSSLTWFLSEKCKSDEACKSEKNCPRRDKCENVKACKIEQNRSVELGVSEENFPFGLQDEAGQHRTDRIDKTESLGEPPTPRDLLRTAILNHIRQRGNYLDPGNGLDVVSLIAMVLKSTIPALLVYFALLLPIMIIVYIFAPPIEIPSRTPTLMLNIFPFLPELIHGISPDISMFNNIFIKISILTVFILTVVSMLYSLATYNIKINKKRNYILRLWVQKNLGYILYITIGTFLLASLPWAYAATDVNFVVGGGLLSSGIAVGIGRLIIQMKSISIARGVSGTLVAVLASALLIYGLLLLSYSASDFLIGKYPAFYGWIVLAIFVFGVIFGWFTNVNYVSLHRLYRDRLMETFLPDLDNVENQNWNPAFKADNALLHEFCIEPESSKGFPGPYHIINTNVVLTDSKDHRYRGRGGASFILSPLYCGSDATGWRPTKDWMKDSGNRGMTLPTAMAISGAALNPRTGADGKGLMRSPIVSFLMSLTNVRLGYWALNPANNNKRSCLSKLRRVPNFLYPGILQGLLAHRYDENSKFIELTDGGHFDNMGLYELIRRKMKLIVLIDGSADPTSNFASLSNSIERIRVDFGVHIRFEDPDNNIRFIDPDTAGLSDLLSKKFGLAERGYAIARIDYTPPNVKKGNEDGILIYVKSTMIQDLPTDIYGYKSAHPEFPDESTADQYFDETQLEAYRELGYRIGKNALDSDEVREKLGL